jgi:hypothetical protein
VRAAGTAEDTAKARKANTARARGHAESLAPIIARLDPDGNVSIVNDDANVYLRKLRPNSRASLE